MLNLPLLTKLIEKNIVTRTTEVDAHYVGIDMAGVPTIETMGTFVILGIQSKEDGFVFEVANVIDGKRRRLHHTAITKIDGMDPQRLASIYGLSSEGEALKQGKRRGRKPKALLEQMAREAAGM